jgi:hypothetical protein
MTEERDVQKRNVTLFHVAWVVYERHLPYKIKLSVRLRPRGEGEMNVGPPTLSVFGLMGTDHLYAELSESFNHGVRSQPAKDYTST